MQLARYFSTVGFTIGLVLLSQTFYVDAYINSADQLIYGAPQDRGTMFEVLHQYPPRNSSIDDSQQYTSSMDIQTPTAGCPYSSKDAYDLFDAIVTTVDSFYDKNANQVLKRLDGGIGLLTLKNQLEYLLDGQKQKVFPELRTLLGRLRDTSGDLAGRFFEEPLKRELVPAKKKLFEAMKRNTNILNGVSKWQGSDAITKHFNEFQNIGNEKEVLYHYLNLQCMAEVIHDCRVPQMCDATQQRDVYSQYMLVQQIMYQQMAQQRSCATLNPEPFKNSKEYQDRLCSKAYLEAEFLESHKFPTKFVMLFSEQVAFCGMLGYPNFMRGDWLQEILSWRSGSASGCMPNLYGTIDHFDTAVEVLVEQKGATTQEECLINLSSVSLAALSMNLRYMVDVCEPAVFEKYSKAHA